MDTQKACDDIISTLATENRWLSNDNYPLYFYQGFWFPCAFIRGTIAAQAVSFDLSPSDIILACNPKSGTTWLKALAFAITTRSRFSQSDPNHPLHLKNSHDLIPRLEAEDFIRSDLNLISTHLPYTGLPPSVAVNGCKIVYIWRDPKDAFVSLWHMNQKMRPNKEETEPIPLQDAFDLFCNGVSAFGPYWDHVLGYWKALLERPESILFLKYEDMMNNTEVHVKKLAEFMGCPFSAEEDEEGVVANIVEMCSFQRLSNLEVNKVQKIPQKGAPDVSKNILFRKAKVGDWANYLTQEMAAKIDQVTMDKFGSHSGLIN
ncbi:uncharacterized protein [Phyllobates terribilis]|uniref:uncharacterized protein n=1 Tax=Phyllobates terribilis TaxID=111132 RepID=UPI003CCAD8B8